MTMSRHLPDCAGDDYCDGGCLYDNIPQPAILKRASKLLCDCDWRLLHHDRKCPSTPLWFHTCDFLEFDPNIWDHKIPIHITIGLDPLLLHTPQWPSGPGWREIGKPDV